MLSIYLVVRLNDDDSIVEVISAHSSQQTARAAERFYWSQATQKNSGIRTDILEVEFSV